ncbi:MAG: thioesterase family protein [Alphaproteobacteria bacterium]
METASSGTAAPPDTMQPEIGQSAEITTQVTDALSAATLGNPGVNVLATPCLAGLCDAVADKACGAGATRRMRVDIRHLAATAIGDDVRISAEIVSATGVLVVCRISGQDSKNEIVRGHVSRVLI